MITGIVLINVERAMIGDVIAGLRKIDGVSEVYSVAGEYDLVAIIRVKDNAELADIIATKMTRDLDGIIDHIKADLGELNPTDERLLCYMIAGFDSSTIAAILDLSLGSVYTRKSRLKDRIRQLDSPYKGQYESQLLLLTL